MLAHGRNPEAVRTHRHRSPGAPPVRDHARHAKRVTSRRTLAIGLALLGASGLAFAAHADEPPVSARGPYGMDEAREPRPAATPGAIHTTPGGECPVRVEAAAAPEPASAADREERRREIALARIKAKAVAMAIARARSGSKPRTP